MEDKWRHWIAKCLTKGHSDAYIEQYLLTKGLPKEEVITELASAKSHPYIKGASEVYQRDVGGAPSPFQGSSDDMFYLDKALNNQAWVLSSYEKLARLDPDFGKIQRINAPPLSTFVSRYISANRPVIIQGAMENWIPKKKWSFDYFRAVHADAIVGIQDGRDTDPDYEKNQKFLRSEVRFDAFLDRLEATASSNDFYMTAGNMGSHRDALYSLFEDAESVDIRGEYFDFPAQGSLWIGPKGTITPLHFDMINNFFCQIIGRKRIRLVPSWSLPWVYNEYHVYSEVDVKNVDFGSFPEFAKATVYDFVIEPGEVLFIPLGWWHHLESLDHSVSLTRKNLKVSSKDAYGDGFVRESRLFKPRSSESIPSE
ncbi:cupin-like domain-containing protein [Luminiphilus sp.]|nr:cupin-like domain-containing protein [Luminiphilus sp.]